MADLAVEAHSLGKRFGGVVAVDGLDLAVPEGEIVGLVGPDGAGKTTTLRILAGILSPDTGSARVVGYDVRRDPEAVKARLGYLPQRFALYRDLTVAENIAYFADLYSVPRSAWLPRQKELLEITRLAPFRNRLAFALSGGMRQKLALICALIHRPRLLLLDEPTTGVDPLSRRDFWRILYELPRQGVTVLITTPYMDEASRCNRVAFMHQGRLLVQDTPPALRSALDRRILELRCRPQHAAREELKGHPAVESVEVFGERLHVVLRPEAAPDAVLVHLAAAGISCQDRREVAPSLEDVFVALTAQGAA